VKWEKEGGVLSFYYFAEKEKKRKTFKETVLLSLRGKRRWSL